MLRLFLFGIMCGNPQRLFFNNIIYLHRQCCHLNIHIMLKNVNAVNVNAENVLNALVYNFGDVAISTCDGGIIKLQSKELGNGDLTCISNLLQYADVKIKRSGSGVGLLILFIPKMYSGPYSKELSDIIDSIKSDKIEY